MRIFKDNVMHTFSLFVCPLLTKLWIDLDEIFSLSPYCATTKRLDLG